MGVAILSGVIASLEAKHDSALPAHAKWESHTPGTVTPQTLDDEAVGALAFGVAYLAFRCFQVTCSSSHA